MFMKRIIDICGLICAAVVLAVGCSVDNTPDSLDRPSITIENNGQISAAFEGGEISLAYSIEKPVDGGVLEVEIPESNTWLDYTITDTRISFMIKENKGKESRLEMMTVRYRYGEESVKNYITVSQQPSEYEYIYDANFAGCIWYDNIYSIDETLIKYLVMLETEDGVMISLDLSAPVNTEDMLPPEGEYQSFEYRTEEGYSVSVGPYASTFISQYYDSETYEDIAIGAMDSKVYVTREGDTYTIKAHIVDYIKGGKFLVRYTGSIEVDNGLISSTLTSDVDETYDAAELGLVATYENYELTPSSRYWIIYVLGSELEVGQPAVYIELISEADALTPESLSGTYIGDADYGTNMSPGTFVPGSFDNSGTWYSEIANVVNGNAYAGLQAPIVSGSVEFISNGDGTMDIVIDGVDDNKEPYDVRIVLENVPFINAE